LERFGLGVTHILGTPLLVPRGGGGFFQGHEPWVLSFLKGREDDIGIEAGAFAGVFTIPLALHQKKGKIVALEPSPLSFFSLYSNLKILGIENVMPLNLALWKEEGLQRLYLHRSPASDSLEGARLIQPMRGEVWVPTTTLGFLITSLRLERVDWLKMDIEGAEREVLKHDRTFPYYLRKYHPRISLEVHRKEDVEWVKRYLENLDYSVEVIEKREWESTWLHCK